jgi:hypothetical protein
MISLSRRQWLIVLGIAMAAFWVVLGAIERRLPTGTPGILEYEFVGDQARAARFLTEWGSDGRDAVRLSLWVDFGFMVTYGAFFTLAALATRDFAREHGLRALAAAGLVAPYCAAIAPIFDAGENTGLLLILGGHGGSAAAPLATACASVKWVLIGLAIAYVLWGLVVRLLRRGGLSRDG